MGGLEGSKKWSIPAGDTAAERAIAEALGLTPLVARILVARGIRDAEAARSFLTPSLERDWVDPLEIPGMAEAADRVEAALAAGETIAIFGDFDVDGMTATGILTLALRQLGGDVHPYIPYRFGEGYGLSDAALERVAEGCSPDLIVTVDNGIAAGVEVARLVQRGIDVVITDHHEPGDLVPEGVPVTDPKLSEDCPSRELAGAGVALKLVCELGRRLGQPDLWRPFIDLATLGTVSDMMLLEGENRSLVAEGIALMRRSARPGIVALAATAGLDLSTLTADQLPFTIIPRLNAAGRMGTTDVAFEVLVCDDPGQAALLAGQLEAINTERRETESALADAVLERVGASYGGEAAIVVAGEGWHEGVKGIVASRVVNAYQVPAIVFSITDGIARGSGRSVGTVDLFHAVEQCSDLLLRFGGHAGAVGVTCEADKIDAFRERLVRVVAELPPEQFEVTNELTAIVTLGELTTPGIEAVERLQPFGQGNKKPILAARGVSMRCRARVGATANHLRFIASDGVSSVPAIMFRAPDIERAAGFEGAVDLVFEAINETWQERTKPKLMVRDIIYREQDEREEERLRATHGPCLCDQLLEGMPAQAPGQAQEQAPDMPATARGTTASATAASDIRSALSALDAAMLTDRIRAALIGTHELLPAQALALDHLSCGENVLAIMATGRGKSLIFHLRAALEAIARGKASVFVFPLRALVGDQSFHLADALEGLGIRVRVLTGETSNEEREATYAGLADGSVDIVLTTPEYLALHADRIAAAHRVSFVVIDEAHHAGMAKGGHREAYLALPRALEQLGRPQVLACTATASDEVAREVCRLFAIRPEAVVIDRTVRANLSVVDQRDLRDRDAALVSLVARGEKTVIYVNSRNESVMIARMLRKNVGELARRIAFYNAGLTRSDRRRVERAFRAGEVSCIVSTSAFGEGVNLPDIRNIVLYHLPFGEVEFNQMSGRAGRDGQPARVYLLYRGQDARINEGILSSGAPSRERLVALYRALRSLCPAGMEVALDDEAIVRVARGFARGFVLDDSTVDCGLAVFSELGFAQLRREGSVRMVRMVESPAHMDLTRSVRYVEGLHQVEEFASFRDWALSADEASLLAQLNRPITPGFGTVADE